MDWVKYYPQYKNNFPLHLIDITKWVIYCHWFWILTTKPNRRRTLTFLKTAIIIRAHHKNIWTKKDSSDLKTFTNIDETNWKWNGNHTHYKRYNFMQRFSVNSIFILVFFCSTTCFLWGKFSFWCCPSHKN